MRRIDRKEAWLIGLGSERVELRGREVWAVPLYRKRVKLEGRLWGITEQEFWEECREGLSK